MKRKKYGQTQLIQTHLKITWLKEAMMLKHHRRHQNFCFIVLLVHWIGWICSSVIIQHRHQTHCMCVDFHFISFVRSQLNTNGITIIALCRDYNSFSFIFGKNKANEIKGIECIQMICVWRFVS